VRGKSCNKAGSEHVSPRTPALKGGGVSEKHDPLLNLERVRVAVRCRPVLGALLVNCEPDYFSTFLRRGTF